MLILCSNGLSSQTLRDALRLRLDGCCSVALVNRYSPEMNTVGITDLAALALTQTEVLPHYSRFLQRFDRFEETCRAYEQERGVQVIRLNDGDGVLLEGSRVILCHN